MPATSRPVRYSETLRAGDAELTVHDTHRPLGAYFNALAAAGFVVQRLAEPVPDEAHVADHADAAGWLERPSFLLREGRPAAPSRAGTARTAARTARSAAPT